MPLTPLELPPGVSRPGTIYDARGRWFASTLVRWGEGVMRAIGGWDRVDDSASGPIAVGEAPRGIVAWRANDGSLHAIFGTAGKLWHFAVQQGESASQPGFASLLTVTSDVSSP